MLICFSRIVDANVRRKYPSNVPIGGADDNFNRRIIEGIEQNGIMPVLINFMPYHSFPSGRFLLYRREETFIGSRKTINIGYINLPIIKSIVIKIGIVREVKKLAKKDQGVNLLIYDSYPAFLNAAITLKKWNKKIKTTLIAPVIPTFDVPRSDIRTRISRKFQKSLLKKDREMDSFVLLTEQMNEVLNPDGKPNTVVEGIIPNVQAEKYSQIDDRVKGKKYVLYSGRLDKIYSIDKLVNSFMDRNDDLYLVLCGIGDYVDKIKEITVENEYVIYLGFKNRPELNSIQYGAAMLVNPRSPQGIYTRYSFPSKTMEYLLTGKPVIMHKLPGIPDEYDPYLYYISEDTTDGIKNAISIVQRELQDGRAERKAKAGMEFVLKKKNEKTQALKVLKLIERI